MKEIMLMVMMIGKTKIGLQFCKWERKAKTRKALKHTDAKGRSEESAGSEDRSTGDGETRHGAGQAGNNARSSRAGLSESENGELGRSSQYSAHAIDTIVRRTTLHTEMRRTRTRIVHQISVQLCRTYKEGKEKRGGSAN